MDCLDSIFEWWTVPDRLPQERATAVFCHTYGNNKYLLRPTDMSLGAINEAKGLILCNKAEYLIVSLSTPEAGGRKEIAIKREILRKNGIEKKIFFLTDGVSSTYDEAQKLAFFIEKIPVTSLIVVADRYHMRRSLQILHRIFPRVILYNLSSVCLKYEMPFPCPNFIRAASVGVKWFNILWNILLYWAFKFRLIGVKK